MSTEAPITQGQGGAVSVMSALQTAKQNSLSQPVAAAPAAAKGPKPASKPAVVKPVKEAKPPKIAKVKEPRKARPAIDEALIAALTQKANNHFGSTLPEGATIEFTVARSKGKPVSITPRIILADGGVQAAGSKNRQGFCTDGKWEPWLEALGEALETAKAKTIRPKTTATGSTKPRHTRWQVTSKYLKEALPDFTVRSVGKRLSITRGSEETKDLVKVCLKREDESSPIQTGSASGPSKVIGKIFIEIASAIELEAVTVTPSAD